jgi:hypothetical protein
MLTFFPSPSNPIPNSNSIRIHQKVTDLFGFGSATLLLTTWIRNTLLKILYFRGTFVGPTEYWTIKPQLKKSVNPKLVLVFFHIFFNEILISTLLLSLLHHRPTLLHINTCVYHAITYLNLTSLQNSSPKNIKIEPQGLYSQLSRKKHPGTKRPGT